MCLEGIQKCFYEAIKGNFFYIKIKLTSYVEMDKKDESYLLIGIQPKINDKVSIFKKYTK